MVKAKKGGVPTKPKSKTVKKATKATKKATKAVKKSPKKAAKAAKTKTAATKAVKKAKKAKRRSLTPKVSLSVYDVHDIPDGQHFYFSSGHKAKNIKELAELMDDIEQEIFESHVNLEKNDFHNWVHHVFNDIELAEKLLGVTGPKHLQFTIYKHVADKALKKK